MAAVTARDAGDDQRRLAGPCGRAGLLAGPGGRGAQGWARRMAWFIDAASAPVAGAMVAATASRLACGAGAPAAWNAAVTGSRSGLQGVPSGGQHFGLVHR